MNTQPISLKTLLVGSILMTQLVACASSASQMPSSTTANRSVAEAARPAAAPAPAATAAPALAGSASSSAQAQVEAERMIIRNATLKLVVKNTEEDMSTIGKMAAEVGGFVNSSSTTKYDKGLQATLSLKIPSKQFDEMMSKLRKLAIEVQEEKITGQDVTAEFSDLDAQVKNLEAAETQLRGILAKTDKSDDVLKVFNELTKVRGQIEQLKGRMNFLSRSAALATINVTLTPDKLAEPVVLPGWRPDGVAKQAFEALLKSLQALGTLAIWLVIYALPVGLLVFGPPVLIILWLRKRRNQRKQAKAPAETKPAA
ncbi:MAG: DUF4349 domain-containing protein [Anaerolineae bacterium]|nr:DUF4349 domain-containing protein [Anaerolineae bacterium]